jgi:hypothetical protein
LSSVFTVFLIPALLRLGEPPLAPAPVESESAAVRA